MHVACHLPFYINYANQKRVFVYYFGSKIDKNKLY